MRIAQKIIYGLTVFSLLFIDGGAVLAQTAYPTPTLVPTGIIPQEYIDQFRMNSARDRGTADLNMRIALDSMLLKRVQDMKNLSAAKKIALSSELQARITKQKSLFSKLQTDSDTKTIVSDRTQIAQFNQQKAFYTSKILIMSFADHAISLAGEIKTKSMGPDAPRKLTDAVTESQSVIDSISPLVPADYPGNRPQLVSARDTLRVVLQDLKDANK